ncbi:MAG: pantoate--beta-alanine ligase [Gammaproteobacteria bacterium]|jgi:pantoate--beta-alanine ligase
MLAHADSAQQLHQIVRPWRAAGQRVALVPTMGNLHDGHLSLCARAREIADRVIVTIFVNPTQFGENEDFDSYPRTLEDDIASLRAADTVDAVLVPGPGEVYPHGTAEAVRIVLPSLSHELCGASRPGHFDGVAGVVLRLLNMTNPDLLILGEKDYQQLVLMRWLVEDLRLGIEVRGMPICRDADGLALSSRNFYLSESERAHAPYLYRALSDVAGAIRSGESEFGMLRAGAVSTLEAHGFKIDYVEVRDADTLQRLSDKVPSSELVVLGAAYLGKARLIDNVRV